MHSLTRVTAGGRPKLLGGGAASVCSQGPLTGDESGLPLETLSADASSLYRRGEPDDIPIIAFCKLKLIIITFVLPVKGFTQIFFGNFSRRGRTGKSLLTLALKSGIVNHI